MKKEFGNSLVSRLTYFVLFPLETLTKLFCFAENAIKRNAPKATKILCQVVSTQWLDASVWEIKLMVTMYCGELIHIIYIIIYLYFLSHFLSTSHRSVYTHSFRFFSCSFVHHNFYAFCQLLHRVNSTFHAFVHLCYLFTWPLPFECLVFAIFLSTFGKFFWFVAPLYLFSLLI